MTGYDTSNATTLASYSARIDAYIAGTAHDIHPASQIWMDTALDGLAPSAAVLELGSAFGRDATYLSSKGVRLTCSDAVPGFVDLLRKRGFETRLYNVLTDALPDRWDLILANAVLLHFNRDEFAWTLTRLLAALMSGGRFAFSIKCGEGEGWSSEKLQAPRYFSYWEQEMLEQYLKQAGYAHWRIDTVYSERTRAAWLYAIAYAD